MTRIVCGFVFLIFAMFGLNQLNGQEKESKKDSKAELKLEDLFPEKSLFGPSVRSSSFSNDGRFAAYLYRTYPERRHRNDLWVYDFKTGESTRITKVSVMAKFQKSTRAVKLDRIKKVKAAKKKADAKKNEGKKKNDSKKEAKSDTKKSKEDSKDSDSGIDVDQVSEKDVDDEKGPRYSGVSSFQWHPEKNGLLFVSQGDVYQIEDIEKPEIVRLTKTASGESQTQYLPDGSGYTFENDDVVYRVSFGSHMIEQLNPRLGRGESLSSYSLSPDGKRLMMVSRTGSRMDGGRTVDIIRYRDRFAKSSSVPRTVSDDEIKPQDLRVYMYDLESLQTEESELIEVFETKIDEPRDVISTPAWSPDSQKLTFCLFDQGKDEVQILMAKFPTPEEMKKLKDAKPASKSTEAESSTSESSRGRRSTTSSASSSAPKKHPAKVVYRFQHFGGPNTPRMVSPNFAWDSHHIVFVSEQTGFRHIHMLDPLYQSTKALTSGNFEAYPIGYSKDHKNVFVTACKETPSRQMIYTLNLESGEMVRIGKEDGNYSSASVSNDGKKIVSSFVKYGQLTEFYASDDKAMKSLTDSHPAKAKELTKTVPDFFEYKNRHGHTIHGMMYKPDGFKKDSKKKLPLLIYVYGGPLGTRKSVVDGSYSSDGYFFQMYMAKKHGYLTVVIDPRGQSGYGGFFEKSNYEKVGKPQVEDLTDGVKFLTENFNVDNKRVAIHGWSFGGFQTQMCLYTEPDVFQVGMAGAGPTEWENYNAWYTTGTVGPSRKGTPDQKKYSLRPLAKNLKGKLLLVHGMEDTNVLFQDTVAIYRELLKAGKETNVELFLDPTGGHGLGGDVKRVNRFKKYEEFLLRTIGETK